ncbi:hypothetical protein, partial [Pseudomonas syringae]|uniref:hypothetical protein n=1 Tax=Pseudomonas syringae TaxID=317 RepID=UPI001CA59926
YERYCRRRPLYINQRSTNVLHLGFTTFFCHSNGRQPGTFPIHKESLSRLSHSNTSKTAAEISSAASRLSSLSAPESLVHIRIAAR